MKTLPVIDANLGQAHVYMAKTLLGAAARKAKLEIIDNSNDAEVAIVLGDSIPNDNVPDGENVWLGNIPRAIAHPELFLDEAKGHAKPYTAPVTATAPVAIGGPKHVVTMTVCPAGVAHTSMAVRAIETEVKKRDWWVRVETRSPVGVGNAITPEEVVAADLVIVAAGIKVDLVKFVGKPIYRIPTGLALRKTAQELDKTVAEAAPYEPAGKTQTATTKGKRESTGAYRHLLTGVSYILPMVAADGLCIALSFTFSIKAFREPGTLAATLIQIGDGSAFVLMVPVLTNYIAFSIADRSDLASGLIGGMLAVNTSSGFIGGIIVDFLTGYIAKLISTQLKLPQSVGALRPILIVPLISSLAVGLAMVYLVGEPVAGILDRLTHWLQIMGTANAVLPGVVLGGIVCTSTGDPVNKAAYAFGVGLLSIQTYDPMAAIMAASMVSPLAVGLATMVAHRRFDKAQQEGGKAALVLGLCFISEGAIPFAARDPIRVLPCCIVGEALTGAISMAIGAKLTAPHGGLFALLVPGAITPVLGYLIAITTGTLVTGLAYAFLKRPETQIVEKNV